MKSHERSLGETEEDEEKSRDATYRTESGFAVFAFERRHRESVLNFSEGGLKCRWHTVVFSSSPMTATGTLFLVHKNKIEKIFVDKFHRIATTWQQQPIGRSKREKAGEKEIHIISVLFWCCVSALLTFTKSNLSECDYRAIASHHFLYYYFGERKNGHWPVDTLIYLDTRALLFIYGWARRISATHVPYDVLVYCLLFARAVMAAMTVERPEEKRVNYTSVYALYMLCACGSNWITRTFVSIMLLNIKESLYYVRTLSTTFNSILHRHRHLHPHPRP